MGRAGPTVRSMALLRRYPDELLALGLALLLSVEAVMLEASNAGPAVGFALVAGGALALRRTLPLVAFLASMLGLAALQITAPGLDGESAGFIVVYFIAHYSLGRWTSGREAWAGAVCVLASMVAFAVGDATDNDAAISQIGLGSVAFTIGFVGAPWAAGLAIRLRRAREDALDLENRRLQDEQEENARRAVAARARPDRPRAARRGLARDLGDGAAGPGRPGDARAGRGRGAPRARRDRAHQHRGARATCGGCSPCCATPRTTAGARHGRPCRSRR